MPPIAKSKAACSTQEFKDTVTALETAILHGKLQPFRARLEEVIKGSADQAVLYWPGHALHLIVTSALNGVDLTVQRTMLQELLGCPYRPTPEDCALVLPTAIRMGSPLIEDMMAAGLRPDSLTLNTKSALLNHSAEGLVQPMIWVAPELLKERQHCDMLMANLFDLNRRGPCVLDPDRGEALEALLALPVHADMPAVAALRMLPNAPAPANAKSNWTQWPRTDRILGSPHEAGLARMVQAGWITPAALEARWQALSPANIELAPWKALMRFIDQVAMEANTAGVTSLIKRGQRL